MNGAQAQRTGLAWRRTALGSAACTLLLLHEAATLHWGRALIPAVLAATTTAVLAVIAHHRERILTTTTPRAINPALPAVASLLVSATAVSLALLP